jgi:hypothetical protein
VAQGELDEFAGQIGREIDAWVVSDFAQLVDRIFAKPPARIPRAAAAVRGWTSRVSGQPAEESQESADSYNQHRAVLVVNAVDERF